MIRALRFNLTERHNSAPLQLTWSVRSTQHSPRSRPTTSSVLSYLQGRTIFSPRVALYVAAGDGDGGEMLSVPLVSRVVLQINSTKMSRNS